MQVRVHAQCTSRAPSPGFTKLSLPAPTDSGWRMSTLIVKSQKSSVMGNSAPAKRWAFAVRKKKEKSCYVMLFSLDCWWIATSYVWVRESMYWTCTAGTTWFGRWVNEPRGGERGCLIFFVSFSGKLISFHFLFWAKKSATGPFMEMRRMPHGHEISFRDMGRMEGEEGGRMYTKPQFSFFSSQLNWGMMKEGLDQRSTLFVHTFRAIHTE